MAGSINAANVAIGFDSTKLVEGVDVTRQEMNKLKSTLAASIPQAQLFAKEVQVLDIAHAKGAIDARKHAEALAYLKEKYEQNFSILSKINSLPGGGVLAGYLGASALSGAVTSMMRLTMEFEQASASIEVLIGNATVAKERLDEMRKLDAESPINFSQFVRGAKTLMGFGLDQERLTATLRQLSEISVGNIERFNHLALALGQVTAAGKLTGQEVMQMVNAGFNPLQQISYDTGKSIAVLRKEMEAGGVSAAMVFQALENATSAGGRFNGMNERLLDTASGAWAKMNSSIETAALKIGNELVPAMKSFADMVERVGKSPVVDVAALGVGKTIEGLNLLSSGLQANVENAGLLVSGFSSPDKFINPVLSMLEYADKLQRDDAARKAQALIDEKEFRVLNVARVEAEAQNKLDMQREAEIALGNERAKIFEDELAKQNDLMKKSLMNELEYEEQKLRKQLNTVGLVAEQKERVEKALESALSALRINFAERERARQAEIDKETADRNRREAEQADKDAKRELERQAREVEQFTARFEAPQDKLIREFEKIDELIAAGLDPLLGAKAREDAAKKLAEAETPKRFGAVSAEEGSREAWRLIVEQENDKKRRDIQAQKTREAMRDALKIIAERKIAVL